MHMTGIFDSCSVSKKRFRYWRMYLVIPRHAVSVDLEGRVQSICCLHRVAHRRTEIHVSKNEYVESGFALVERKFLPSSRCLQLAFSEEQCGVDVRDVDLE